MSCRLGRRKVCKKRPFDVSSARRDEVPRFRYETRVYQEHDDPINTGIVDPTLAETLFQFFVDHCHPFLPIINITQQDAFASVRGSAPLFSAVISTASRFYSKYRARRESTGPTLDGSIPARLANLAEAHLGQTLLRRHYALSDVQAILLLAAWGLQSAGRSGPDPWVVTGHAARVSRRLGVHKALAQAAAKARATEQGSEEWCKLQSFVPQWRTWLCWFTFDGFLSLGFGRPQSTQFETVDESGFLQMRLHQAVPWPGSLPKTRAPTRAVHGSSASLSLYGDVYIAGLVQLTQIGRDLINWIEMLVDPEKAVYADPRRAEIFRGMDLSMKNMFRELNGRIEDWSRLWVWTGSQYALHLGPSARLARLQADHLRLCLNSYALKGRADEDEEIAKCLRAALNAATSTIQTHHESSQTDLGLSFATDYLTIALAQAAVFLIQITKAPVAIQAMLQVDNAVLTHYWKMSVDILESSDMSETRLGTYLAKTICGMGRKTSVDEQSDAFDPHSLFSANYLPVADTGALNDDAFNIEDYFQGQADFDLKYLLSLPSDGESILQDGTGVAGFSGDAGFGMDVMSGVGQRWSGLDIHALLGFSQDGTAS
ncbi:hypothetical protein JCM24511_10025 [Saitozyma sp. JCM 24511]|nr:hypothetical protein JCM24511_10025 [Saitozyma sp. JCM 24511]